MAPIQFIRPSPSKLSRMTAELAAIEAAGVYSNYGPLNTRFETRLAAERFAGIGECLTVCNATIGLMMAIRAMTGMHGARGRYALMPSFTFAATAHAAIWAGLTPLFCDIDPRTWLPCRHAEAALLRTYGSEIAVIVPCATFGASLDLDRYAALSKQHGVAVVVDAAGALGARDDRGRPFGAGCGFPLVFSMHATKTFAVGEGGVIYADNPALMHTLRAMGNFGFGQARSATMLGLNAKLSEVSALLALAKLDEFDQVLAHRAERVAQYHAELPGWTFQRPTGQHQPVQFVAVEPPRECARDAMRAALTAHDIGSGAYFSPHLAEQPYFQAAGVADDLRHTDRLAPRVLALPMSDSLTEAEVARVCEVLRDSARSARATPHAPDYADACHLPDSPEPVPARMRMRT